jgi:hypothetical protein
LYRGAPFDFAGGEIEGDEGVGVIGWLDVGPGAFGGGILGLACGADAGDYVLG